MRCFEGESELLLVLRDDTTQHHGFAHGAIIGLLADNACAWVAGAAAPTLAAVAQATVVPTGLPRQG